MPSKSNIEWTEATWNPVTGCTKISAGCKNCYAERIAIRLQNMGVEQYRNGFELNLAPHVLNVPRQWKKQRVVFVNSMSDLFHKKVPLEYIQSVFQVMNETQHIYQVLTKRSKRLKEIAHLLKWTANIWMGVSVENEKAVYRVKDLEATPAQVKFLSIEPLIGPIPSLELKKIDWIIVGGESGPKARPLQKVWVDDIFKLCSEKNIPFFFKQWGKKSFNPNAADPTLDKKNDSYAKGGCQLDGKIYRALPFQTVISK